MSTSIPGAVPFKSNAPGAVGEIRDHVRPEATDRIKRRGTTEAGRRLERVEFEVDAVTALSDAAYANVTAQGIAKGEAQGRLARILDPENRTKPDDAEVRFNREAVERGTRQHEEAIGRNRIVTKDLNVLRTHLLNCTALLNVAPNADQVPLPKLKGDPDKLIAEIDSEERRVKAAPHPVEEVEAELIGQLDSWAADARLRITFGKRPAIGVPVVRVAAEPSGEEIPHAPDIRPWLARLPDMRDALVAEIRERVGEQYKDVELTLSERDKRQRLAELADQRLAADRVRCARIWERFEAGEIDRLKFPRDADPRAILGIDGPDVRRKED